MTATDASLAAGLVAFSGITAMMAARLAERRAQGRVEVAFQLGMAAATVLFAIASVMVLVGILLGTANYWLRASSLFGLVSMAVIAPLAVWYLLSGLKETIAKMLYGVEAEASIEEDVETGVDDSNPHPHRVEERLENVNAGQL